MIGNVHNHTKIQGRRKTQSHLPWCFHSTKNRSINSTKAGAAERVDFMISFGLTAWRPFLFYSSQPSLAQKQSFPVFFFFLWGFVSSIVLKRLTLPKWIDLVHHWFVKGSLANRVHPPRMTSRLFGRTLICPSRMNCILFLPCFSPTRNKRAVLLHMEDVWDQELGSGGSPPPRCMRPEHWKEPSRLYSRDSQQVLIFWSRVWSSI